jgi:V8-like Glu-specific endopeptidase
MDEDAPEYEKCPDEIVINGYKWKRVPMGTSWDSMTKITTEQGHYGGFLVYVDAKILEKLKKNHSE